MIHCDRLSSRISTAFTFSMKVGRFVKSRQKSYSSWRGRLIMAARMLLAE